MKIIRNSLLIAALLIATCFLAAPIFASCQYHLNFENEAGQKIDIQKVKWKKKVVADWKPWKNVEQDLFSLEDKGEKELQRKEDSAVCYRFKWKFQWRCSNTNEWNEAQLGPDNPDNDRVSNYFVQFEGCGANDFQKSQDGGALP